MTRTALFFGSFNPIHLGHIAIVRHLLESGLCDELWLVVSPGNPLKEPSVLVDADRRLEMTRLAVDAAGLGGKVRVSDVEFAMPRPSYTIDTLERLERDHPDREFMLLAGSDITGQLEQWKDYRKLLDRYTILIYPRPGYPVVKFADRVVVLEDAPQSECSSTRARGGAEQMLQPEVKNYIKTHKLWTESK
ncbi:putative nicotinate-nucleotide adenylyltransferase [Bacteroidia bacterium]|nr:putative nicotinate-nucleotide adenylyltransferase [Bacteroidia bacterium]